MELLTGKTHGNNSQINKGDDLPSLKTSRFALTVSVIALLVGASAVHAQSPLDATAAGTNRPLNLAKNSPFRDPDVIYLEADELINDEAAQTLTAVGEVEGRYQDRTLRAEQVVYNLNTGEVFASGNVVLIDATGATQYATRIELSSELETGTATDFTARFPEGGMTGASIARRTSAQEVELYNAYYTACEVCEDDDGKFNKPTWRIKARKVSQDRKNSMIKYRDAVFEFKGIPLFYTPYLAHPDPSAGRTSGFLNPFGGLSSSKGLNVRMPYFWAIDDYTDLTITPRVFRKVNPILTYNLRRKFFSGELNVEGSLTYGSVFDKRGDPFTLDDNFLDPSLAPIGKRLRSHVFASALFDFNETWRYGAGFQAASDDTLLNRYDLNEKAGRFGLYEPDSRRLVSQAFIIGQTDDFRLSTSAYGFQSLLTNIREDDDGNLRISREDDSTLPIVAPKIELTKYITDPVVGGRFKLKGDATKLTRKIGSNYLRASGGVEWNKTFIAPGGIEIQPFGEARADYLELETDGSDPDIPVEKTDFSRTLGQVGVDVRYPFIKSSENVDFIIEPRAQVTQKFGNGKLDNFDSDGNGTLDLIEDSLDVDLDQALLWSPNKATGYDFWQKGLRADVGASFIADWDKTRAHMFVGKSFARNTDADYLNTSGLSGRSSDFVGLFELDVNGKIVSTTRVRYDDNNNKLRRLDTQLTLKQDWFKASARYYRLESPNLAIDDIPLEEISGGVTVDIFKDWKVRYRAVRDLDEKLTRNQNLSLIFDDQCTRIEFIYTKNKFDSETVRDTSGFGIRVSLLSLGDFSPD